MEVRYIKSEEIEDATKEELYEKLKHILMNEELSTLDINDYYFEYKDLDWVFIYTMYYKGIQISDKIQDYEILDFLIHKGIVKWKPLITYLNHKVNPFSDLDKMIEEISKRWSFPKNY